MEGQSQGKGKIEEIRTEADGPNPTVRRPKNFSLQRRSDVFYFADNSGRGILKRVPVKYDGSYKMSELQTVFENPDAAKKRNESWSAVPLNSPGSSKADKNSTAAEDDDSYESVHSDKTAGNEFRLDGLKNLASLKAHQDYPKHKNDGKKLLKDIHQDQKEERFYKQFKGTKKKKYQSIASVPTDSGKLKGSDLDEKYAKGSALNFGSSSSKDPDEPKDNQKCLSETLMNDALNMMQMKTPTTEL